MTSFPRGSMSRPSPDRPTGLWLARLILLSATVASLAWMAGWVSKYVRF